MKTLRGHILALAIAPSLVVLATICWLLFCADIVSLEKVQRWINTLGMLGPATFFLLYVVAVVLLVPGSVLAITAGLVYGLWGVPLALAAATSGATISFFVARYLAHTPVQALTTQNTLWRAIEQSVSDGGWRVVGLLRVSPLIPFNLLNYFFGITRIRFQHYLPGTLIGITPGTTVNVFLASAGEAITLGGLSHPLSAGILILGTLVTIAVAWAAHLRVRHLMTLYLPAAPNEVYI